MSKLGDILDALETALAGITQANGYHTDAGLHVHLRREFELEPPEKPALILWPGDVSSGIDGDVPPSLGEENHLLPFEIEGYITCNERGDETEELRQDILKVLRANEDLGGETEGYSGNLSSTFEVMQAGDGGMLGHVQVKGTIFFCTLYGSED
jgi:hypothetical protein